MAGRSRKKVEKPAAATTTTTKGCFVVWRRTSPKEWTVDKYETWDKALEAVRVLVPETTLTTEKLGPVNNDVMVTKVVK